MPLTVCVEDTEVELRKIEENTAPSWWAMLWHNLLRGAAFTLGSVLIIGLLGWVLSALGVIPGVGAIAQYLRSLLPATPM